MTSDCKNALQTHKPLYGCYSGMGPEWGHDHGLLIFSSQLGLKRTQRLQRVRVQARLSQRIVVEVAMVGRHLCAGAEGDGGPRPVFNVARVHGVAFRIDGTCLRAT